MIGSVKCNRCKCELSNNEIALNFKLFGKQIGKILCYSCLSTILACDVSKLKEKASRLKKSGCGLFMIDYLKKESKDVSYENNISKENMQPHN